MRHDPLQSSFAFNVVDVDQPTYLLRELEVYNWGPFDGFHRAQIDPNGTGIIGSTGSGKTTLVDAMMTLLVFQPRYNLASTGGHESDRTLISYVRGVLGGDGANGREEVLRPNKTITGLCATYYNGKETIKLASLFWIDSASQATSDLKKRWIFSQANDQSLEQWLELLHEDGVRDLMKLGRQTANLRIYEPQKQYLTHVRKFFDVGENAFTLLNRAAGLKQLNSIDDIFRDLVLDDRSQFDRAQQVASEFDDLEAIHKELKIAQKQRDTLIPVAKASRKLQEAREKESHLRTLKRIVPIWFAIQGRDRWDQVFNEHASDLQKKNEQLNAQNDEKKTCEERVDTLLERYLNLGGNVIKGLEKTIESQEALTEERRKNADEYRTLIRNFNLNETLTEEVLQENKTELENKRGKIQAEYDAANERNLDALSRIREINDNIKQTTSDLQQVQSRPSSNIPPKFQAFRSLLANKLKLDESDLPFVAEMVQVKQTEMDWRGAIERAIGSERLRILVHENHIKEALRWVNNRENQLHVRLQQANHHVHPRQFLPDGFTHKLNIKNHPLINTVKDLLASRDLHCVNSPDELQTTDHALTMQGMMSGRRGRYEKQDQRNLNEDWMTGFDNKDQLKALRQNLHALTKDKEQKWEPISNESNKQRSACSTKLTIIDCISKLEFTAIDLPKAKFELEQSQTKLKELLDPTSDASQAKSEYDDELTKLKSLEGQIRLQERAINFVEVKQEEAAKARDHAANRVGEGLNEVEIELAQTSLPIPDELEVEQLDELERSFRRDADQNLDEQTGLIEKCITNLTSCMSTAKREDTGTLADYSNSVEDVPAYLDRLDVLTKEALPEKQERFMEYLNRSSDQGVTQLLASINEEVDNIKERIDDLNKTLAKVDFRDGRFLQLQPQHTKDECLRAVEKAMQKVRSDALLDDQGESHYKSLRELVGILREAGENRRLKGSRELLDPRYRLQFFVVEVDRNTLKQSPKRTGSQSGSGGEKELMASHVLTASLSYALCPAQASRPLYGTIVLDEAFSKSSPSAANRIIDALRIFNLHPIFVTPNKEIGLLKKHTRKVICVQRLAKCATLASISWEELEGHRQSK